MLARGVRLHYGFQPEPQTGAGLDNPLFDLLRAVHEQGSIQHAARAMGASYRHVWGALRQWQEVLGEPLVTWTQGQPARLTPFGLGLLRQEGLVRARLAPHLEALRAELGRVLAEALDGPGQPLALWSGHDPLAELLRREAAASGLFLQPQGRGGLDALQALADGRATVALVHLPTEPTDWPAPLTEALRPLRSGGRVQAVGLARRALGLVTEAGRGPALATAADLAQAERRWAGRAPGSVTRLLADHRFEAARLPAARRAELQAGGEDSALAVAARVAAGQADAGLATAAAAAAFGLEFQPWLDQEAMLLLARPVLDSPPVQALLALLARDDLAQALAGLPGVEPWRCGEWCPLPRPATPPRARRPR